MPVRVMRKTVSATESLSRRTFLRGAVASGIGLAAANYARILGANDRLQLGVIGTGIRGQDVLRAFLKDPAVVAVAMCDAYDENFEKARALVSNQVRRYRDHRALLDDREVDCVLIATPDHWHARQAIDACQAGKDIYIEKPLTFDIDEGRRVVRAAREHRRIVQVGLQQRSGKHYLEAKRLYFDTRKLGKVTMVRTWWHGNSFHLRKPDFTAQPPGLDWRMFLGPRPYRPFNAHQFYNWRAYLDFGGGMITDLFTHWIDVVHWFMGEDMPSAAVAAGGIYHYRDGRTAPDTINVLLEYPGGWTATFEGTLAPGARGASIEFIGTEGRLEISRGGYTFVSAERNAPPVTVKAEGDMTVDHVRDFLEAVRARRAPSSEVLDGHRSTQASLLGKIAYLKRERVTFNPSADRLPPFASSPRVS